MFVRQLIASDWRNYKRLRMEALTLHQNVFGISKVEEEKRDDQSWKDMLDRQDQAFFGLVNKDHLIGMTGVITDTYVENSRTAVFIASYLRKDFRGSGLSAHFYEARIGWARNSGQFDRIVVSHREGNNTSRAANQKFGFKLYCVEETTWPDNQVDKIYRYEMRI